MATQWQTFPVEFRGGLISNQSPLQQGINAIGSATVLQNMEPDRRGGYTKITGFDKFSSTEIPGTGNVLGLKCVSSTRAVVARKVDADAITDVAALVSGDENKTAYYYGTGSTWTHMATSANTNGNKVYHSTYNFDGDDKTVFVDGTNYPAIYNSSGNTMTFLSASSTNINTDLEGAELVTIYKNTGFYSKGNTVYFSAPFTVDNFSVADGAGTISVGNDVTGFAVFRDQLIIFTVDSIKRLTGSTSSDFQLTSVTDRIGCISADSIQEFGGDIIYLAPDGIRLLSATDRIGDFALDVASDKAYKEAEEVIDSTSNFASCVIRNKSQYRLFSFISTQNSSSAKGIVATKFSAQGASNVQWSTTKGIKAYISDSVYTGTTEAVMFANEDGYIYEMEEGISFDGDDIEAVYESPYMPITDPQTRKTAYKLTLYTEPQGNMELNFKLLFDFDSGNDTRVVQPNAITIGQTIAGGAGAVAIFGTAVFGTSVFGGKLKKVYNENLIGSFHTVAMRIEDTSTNPAFTLDTAVLEYRQNDRQ